MHKHLVQVVPSQPNGQLTTKLVLLVVQEVNSLLMKLMVKRTTAMWLSKSLGKLSKVNLQVSEVLNTGNLFLPIQQALDIVGKGLT